MTDGSGYYTFPNLTPGPVQRYCRALGFPEGRQRERPARRRRRDEPRLHARRPGALTESVTVSADTPLQTDVAIRKTVEAKDIELLAFSGRNPIGVVGLKAGVNGGNFNSRGFGDLGNGGFNINGSRPDENNITIDGADGDPDALVGRDHRHPERRRGAGSAGADRELHARVRPRQRRADPVHHQERQQPLHRDGRVLPTATKACRRTRGRATAAPTRSTTQGPAPFDYKQYGYSFGGPIPVR